MSQAPADVRSLGSVPDIFDHPRFPRRTLVVPVPVRVGAEEKFASKFSGKSATPAEILLGCLNHPSLRLRKPIPLKIEREEGHVVAAWLELDEFGYGAYLTAAVEDFRQTLVEVYLGLEGDQENLGPELQALWRSLQEWVVKK